MDHFGISHAMLSMVDMYQRSSRRTGRTTALLDSLKDGDRVLCFGTHAANDLKHRIRERGLKVEVMDFESLGDAHRATMKRSAEGRTIFDHTFVEKHFEQEIKKAATALQVLQNLCSQEAERNAIEMAKLNRSRFLG